MLKVEKWPLCHMPTAQVHMSMRIHTVWSGHSLFVDTLYKSPLILFVCVEVLRPSQPNGVMSSMVSLPNHISIEQAYSS